MLDIKSMNSLYERKKNRTDDTLGLKDMNYDYETCTCTRHDRRNMWNEKE